MLARKYILFFLLFFIAICSACSKVTKPSVSYFLVRVDSISIPDSIPQADTLKVKLYGTIGNNGAYSFDHFEASRDSHRLELAVWGKRTEMDIAPQVIIELRGREYPVFPAYPPSFKVNVRQPDSTFLRDSVVVY